MRHHFSQLKLRNRQTDIRVLVVYRLLVQCHPLIENQNKNFESSVTIDHYMDAYFGNDNA